MSVFPDPLGPGSRTPLIPATRVVLGSVFALAIAIVAGTALILGELRSRQIADAEREIANLSRILAEQTARTLQSVDLILKGATERVREGQTRPQLMEEGTVRALMQARLSGVPQIRALFILDAQGRLSLHSQAFPTPKLYAGDRDYFKVHVENPGYGLYIDKPTRSRLTGQWTIQASRRIDGPGGEFLGVFSAALDPAYFEALYRDLELGRNSSVSLFLRDGTLLVRQPRDEALIGRSYAGSPAFLALAQPSNDIGGTHVLRTAGANATLVGVREVGPFPLVVEVCRSEDALLAQWRRDAALIASGAAAVTLLLVAAGVFLARELSREAAMGRALRDSEARMSGIVQSAMDAIITVDENQRIVLFNPAAEKVFRCPAAEAIGSPLERFIPERFRAAHRRHVERFAATGATSRKMGDTTVLYGLRAGGEEFPIDASISQVMVGGRRLYTVVLRDITLRRQAEEELRESHDRLRELTAALESVREEERARISRELHDELGQQLTALRMDVSWLASRLSSGSLAVLEKLNGMKATIDATVRATRQISAELRPLVLSELGLVAAAEWLVQDFSRRTGIKAQLDLDVDEHSLALDDRLATAMFRALQESLTNVARHSGASRVNVSLAAPNGALVLKVQDNGKGMAPGEERKSGAFGLLGMRERVQALGGETMVRSSPGKGTTVEVSVPLNRAAAGEAR
ncbi:PAS domain S-box protein [Pelomicrobium sp. G1]|uniref:PAS domain S-box protein n=1 Tax=unclassified Pelomicrobium TaxID=2815318 RepID=UPI003F75C99E